VTTPAVQSGPDVAERAGTVLSHAPTSVIEIGPDLTVALDALGVDRDGSLVLIVEAGGALADRVAGQSVAGTLHSALVSPVPGPDRVFDAVTAHGTVEFAEDIRAALEVLLTPFPERPAETVLRPDASVLLRMRVAQLRLGGVPVDAEAYALASADPLAADSDQVVTHLLCAHPEQVVLLAHLLDADLLRDAHAVAPVRVDRFGVTIRVDHPTGSRRARLDFPAALRGPAELPAAMRELQCRAAQVTACPFDTRPHPG
jgi:hypothetical protein